MGEGAAMDAKRDVTNEGMPPAGGGTTGTPGVGTTGASGAGVRRPPLGADAIARAVRVYPPTPEQRAVIEFAEDRPALVIAGAGAGKTETMARRVVWLVANRVVRPDQVLGLTFTRKAAGELAQRIDQALRALARSGLVDDVDLDRQPEVSTYNAFANALFQDNALRVGREPDSTLLTEAGAWALAHQVVLDADDEDALIALGLRPERLAEVVIALDHEMVDNEADPDAVVALAGRFTALRELPPKPRARKPGPGKEVLEAVEAVEALETLVPLVQEYERRKRERGVIEYSDQVALALRAIRADPAAAALYRQRYDAILLDEYQDTSVSQTRLLAALFRGRRVMAVGDPNQSIYGWRGASSRNLAGFHTDFAGDEAGAGDSATRSAATFTLATSWRNSHRVLAAANALVADVHPGGDVPLLRLAPRPGAPDGAVDVTVAPDIEGEATEVARWMADRLQPHETAAVLFRARQLMPVFARALDRAGVPCEIVGFAGVLTSPEVVDVLSAMRVVHSVDADNALVRLLAGERWRVGPADLDALGRIARRLDSYDADLHRLDADIRRRLRESVARDDHATLVDAVDLLLSDRPLVTRLVAESGMTDEGLRRLRQAARTIRGLRAQSHLPVPEFLRVCAQRLLVDVELVANETRRRPLANLHALHAKAVEYEQTAPSPSLGGFLAWIDQVERRERLAAEAAPRAEGVVQLLTVHASKGLEWDHVAVVRLVDDELPARLSSTRGWLTRGVLPYPLRGDAADLPRLDWEQAADAAEFGQALERYRTGVHDRHLGEERRIAYVALTRAREDLLLTASRVRPDRARPRTLSPFLVELMDRGVAPDVREAFDALPEAPESTEPRLPWPVDPLGDRRETVQRAADAVARAQTELAGPVDVPGTWPDLGPWEAPVRALLAERGDRDRPVAVALPRRVAASRMHEFLADPEAVAAQLFRPMPSAPHSETRVGTLFHEWVERRYRVTGLELPLDEPLAEFDEGDPSVPVVLSARARERLEALQRAFEASPWSTRRPVAVETQIRLPLGEVGVVCRLDAVFRTEHGHEVVDWKTGRPPRDAAEIEQRQIQLALYRLAWAQHAGEPVDQVDACLYYVREDRVIRLDRLVTIEGLAARWAELAAGGARLDQED